MENNKTNTMHAGAKPELFRFAEKLRKEMTAAEQKLWEFLRKKPEQFKFRRQHPFYIYILDLYCHKAKLAIEIDGEYHDLSERKKLDDIRTNTINQMGITEMMFRNEEVLADFENVVDAILSYCRDSVE